MTEEIKKVHETLIQFLVKNKESKELLGDEKSWKITDLDEQGNMNYIFLISGEKGKLVIKYTPPYVRCVGESWKIDTIRGEFETKVLLLQKKHVPELVPKIYFYDKNESIICMEYLSGMNNLRTELSNGKTFPNFEKQMIEYYSNMAFKTSNLYLSIGDLMKQNAEFYKNFELCQISQQVIFHEPYYTCDNNNWTKDELLNKTVKSIQANDDLKLGMLNLLTEFRQNPQCLAHGDLHTGSIMVNKERTVILDPEFAFPGPIAFDLGLFIGNSIIAYFSQFGLESKEGDRNQCKGFILSYINNIWNGFYKSFIHLWNTEHKGDLYNELLFKENPKLKLKVQEDYMKKIFNSTLGYAGLVMIRRVIGIASCPEMLKIENELKRAKCEISCLLFGEKLILSKFDKIETVIKQIKEY